MYQPNFNINTRSKTRSKRETMCLDKDLKKEKELKEEKEKDKEKEKEEYDVKQCIICWGENNVYKMQSFVIVKNSCQCNSLFHGSCFFKWVYETNSCPICRKPSVFNVKLLNRFLNKPISNEVINVNNNNNQIIYNRMAMNNNRNRTYDLDIVEEHYQNKVQFVIYITYNIVKGLCKFTFCLCFYSFLFVSFMSINREVQMIE
jgi:hypothetical protein